MAWSLAVRAVGAAGAGPGRVWAKVPTTAAPPSAAPRNQTEKAGKKRDSDMARKNW